MAYLKFICKCRSVGILIVSWQPPVPCVGGTCAKEAEAHAEGGRVI